MAGLNSTGLGERRDSLPGQEAGPLALRFRAWRSALRSRVSGPDRKPSYQQAGGHHRRSRSLGRIWLKPDGIGYFAGDLPEAEQKVVWATQAVPVPDLFTQKVDGVAWRSKPSWYIVAAEDRAVHPDLKRFAAKRMGATTVELRSSHVPMLSQPHAVLDVIRNAAKAIQVSKAA
jgi:pimeloyl-ACP methyl ester carboxylesterase